MSDAIKSKGFMDHGKTNCGLLVMKDVKRTGLSHSRIERFEDDQFPEWVGELHCDDSQCQCRRYLRTKQA